MKVVGDNGSMELVGEFIVISRAVAGPATSSFLLDQPDKSIAVGSVTEVRFKAAGLFRGHLRLSINGQTDTRPLVTDDENAVIFSVRSLPEFERFQLALADRMRVAAAATDGGLALAHETT